MTEAAREEGAGPPLGAAASLSAIAPIRGAGLRHLVRLVGIGLLAQSAACGQSQGDGAADVVEPPGPRFRQVVLDDAVGEPVALAVLPDASVLYTQRRGQVKLHDAATGQVTVAAEIPVYTHDEEGLGGIAIDPAFPEQPWVYLYYSPPLDTPAGDAPEEGPTEVLAPFQGVARLSRFRFEQGLLLLETEQVLLEVPMVRGACCHLGGQIDFDADGNLYLSTGDDTNPRQSDGFSPIDDRPNRSEFFDARRSAGNSNDLRGKILRIRVEPDGAYSIPSGNLFAPGEAGTRPEIYAMGLRNPYRFAVDRSRGGVYVADYAPDSSVASPERGPAGTAKWFVMREPGNYGWPFCATAELPYNAHDFATGVPGAPFDCQAPANESRHNTGRSVLPAVAQPDFWYSYGLSQRFPELGQGQVGPMAGPAYHFDADRAGSGQWPAEYDGAALFYEWTRGFILPVTLDAQGRFEALGERLALPLAGPIDMEFGPDGALYLLEYGRSYFEDNPEAKLSRIEFR